MEEYFTPKALMRFTLWKDNQRSEAKLFGNIMHYCFSLLG